MSDTAVYLEDWASDGEAGMLRDFGIAPERLEGFEVIVASYTYEDYSGSAYVLLKKGQELYEVHGGHCSCYGLSESNYSGNTQSQWYPEIIDREALLHRLKKGYWETPEVKQAVIDALDLRPPTPIEE